MSVRLYVGNLPQSFDSKELDALFAAVGEGIRFKAVQDRATLYDFNATILHLLGLDHERLTFRHGGRDERLTDVAGCVIERAVAA